MTEIDRFGNPIEWNNQLGHTALTHRNASGQMVKAIGADSDGNLTTETDELSNAATYTFDTLNRLTSSTDRENATTSFEYL